MKNKFIVLCVCLIFLFMFTLSVSAHPGKTDANGGHWDHSTGEYHYHHGYPAHSHEGGTCPYEFNDRTGENSGSSSSSNSRTITESTTAPEKQEEKRSVIGIVISVLILIICGVPLVLIGIKKLLRRYIMCLKKTNNREQMVEYVKNFMISYLVDHADAGNEVVPIFTSVKSQLLDIPEKTLTKQMRKNHLSLEETILNIMQNHALMAIIPQNPTDYILGNNSEAAHNLYDYINDLKLEKHYIGKRQYEENKKVGDRAGVIPPGGRWL